jgi:hypothetical protein
MINCGARETESASVPQCSTRRGSGPAAIGRDMGKRPHCCVAAAAGYWLLDCCYAEQAIEAGAS